MNLENTADKLIISAIPSLIVGDVPKGRLRNRLEKLTKLTFVPGIGDKELNMLKLKLDKFQELTGWHKKARSLITLINFCLLVAEDAGLDQRVIECLNDIYDYFNREKTVPSSCDWSGESAFHKWRSIEL